MPDLDVDQYGTPLVIRTLRPDDFDDLLAMQRLCFPGITPWTAEQLESQIRVFPEGQIVIEIDGKMAASSSSLVLTYDEKLAWHDWSKVSDGGFIRNHNPRGDTLYGLEMMVLPQYRGMRLSRRLYDARKDICRSRNLARIIIGGRIPGYHRYADRWNAREYVEQVIEKALYDPVLTSQISNGFALQRLIPNYLPSDTDSCGYATFLEWSNVDYQDRSRRRSAIVETIRVCVVQYEMRSIANFDEFARQCEYFLDTAADYKSDFVLFPELLTTQLLSCIKPERPGLAARTLANFTPQYLEHFRQLAIRYNVNVIGGSQFVLEGEELYNTAFLFHRDGTISSQRKIHVTPVERRWYGVAGGSNLEVFDTDCGRIAILIGYDIEFPELARWAAKQGASLCMVPFNTDTRPGYLRIRTCAAARCIENHMYVAIAGCTGNLPFVENADIHYAQSGIFTPSGQEFSRDAVAGECSPNVETVVIQDLDFELLRRQTEWGTPKASEDRRDDIYRIVILGDGETRSPSEI